MYLSQYLSISQTAALTVKKKKLCCVQIVSQISPAGLLLHLASHCNRRRGVTFQAKTDDFCIRFSSGTFALWLPGTVQQAEYITIW